MTSPTFCGRGDDSELPNEENDVAIEEKLVDDQTELPEESEETAEEEELVGDKTELPEECDKTSEKEKLVGDKTELPKECDRTAEKEELADGKTEVGNQSPTLLSGGGDDDSGLSEECDETAEKEELVAEKTEGPQGGDKDSASPSSGVDDPIKQAQDGKDASSPDAGEKSSQRYSNFPSKSFYAFLESFTKNGLSPMNHTKAARGKGKTAYRGNSFDYERYMEEASNEDDIFPEYKNKDRLLKFGGVFTNRSRQAYLPRVDFWSKAGSNSNCLCGICKKNPAQASYIFPVCDTCGQIYAQKLSKFKFPGRRGPDDQQSGEKDGPEAKDSDKNESWTSANGVRYQRIPYMPYGLFLQKNFCKDAYEEWHEICVTERSLFGSGNSPFMISLYRFWTDFLKRNYSKEMYEEFRTLAKEDAAATGIRYGLECLFRFYSYGLEVTYRPSLYKDFEEETMRDYESGHMYGLEKFWAFLKYYKFSRQLTVEPKLAQIVSRFKTIEDFLPFQSIEQQVRRRLRNERRRAGLDPFYVDPTVPDVPNCPDCGTYATRTRRYPRRNYRSRWFQNRNY